MLWRYTMKDGRWCKVPYQVNGKPASSTDPDTWAPYDEVVDEYVMGDYDGLGFALGDELFGIDADDCRSEDGTLSQLAKDLLDKVDGYAEVSPSGTGIKIFTRSSLNFSKNDKARGLEAYSGGRYFTVTGHQLNGHDSLPQSAIDLSWLPGVFGETERPEPDADWYVKPPLEGWDADRIRNEILAFIDPEESYETWIKVGHALYHQFEGGDEGLELWDEWSQGGASYAEGEPEYKWTTFNVKGNGRTVTLASLIKQSNENPEKEQAIIKASAEGLQSVLERIEAAKDMYEIKGDVAKAVRVAGLDPIDHEVAVQRLAKKIQTVTGAKPAIKDVRDMCKPDRNMAGAGQIGTPEWAIDYVWITSEDQFAHIPTQEVLTKTSFNAAHNRHVQAAFGDDAQAADVALDVFQIDVVHRRMYLPWADLRFSMDNVYYLNSYRPSSVPEAADTCPPEVSQTMWNHLLAICSEDEYAARLLLQWLAHNVQKPGVKIRWSPLIKGIEGDGKTILSNLMKRVMGDRQIHIISPTVLRTDFNGWAEGACVGIMEELRATGHNRYDVANALKPNITNDVIPIHRKGMDEYNVINTMNYLAFTNHEDALPLTEGDRRWFIIFTPYRQPSDLPGPDYYAALFDLVRDHGAELRRWLLEVDLAGFDANGRAPDSVFKQRMIANSISDEEWAAVEIIEDGGLGVSSKVVSSAHLTAAIAQKLGHRPSTSAVNKMLSKLGYEPFTTDNKSQLKWNGGACRVWFKDLELGDEPKKVLREALNETL